MIFVDSVDARRHCGHLYILRKMNLVGHDDDGDYAAAVIAVRDSVDLISLNKNYFHLMI
jgi:hypothetical protein